MDENPYKAPNDRGRVPQSRNASTLTVIGIAGAIALWLVIIVAAYRFISDYASAMGHS